MLDIIGRIVPSRRQPLNRSRATEFRLNLERLESRELLTIPLPPTGVVANGVSASAIAISWNASTNPTVTGYNLIERRWAAGGGGKGGSHPGHYYYVSVANSLPTHSYSVTGLASGSVHTYLVTAVNSSGSSLYSLPTTGETWFARSLSSTYYQLSNGYESYGSVSATAGMTTQIKLYGGGNPLTFSVLSGPKTVSIDPKLGVVSYTPAKSEVGTVNITFQASNPLGSATQTIQFNVIAANSSLATPKLTLTRTTATYNGQAPQVSATSVGTDGVTPVSGSFAFAYNGGPSPSPYAGSYTVLATFTSADPKYGNATLVGKLTINRGQPGFSALTPSTTIVVGTASAIVSGNIGVGLADPTGEYVIITLNGVSVATTVNNSGNFSTALDTSTLAVGNHTITYAYAGDANLYAAANGQSSLTVIPMVPPKVTQNPSSITVSAGDFATFTASASGTPVPSVQWQLSTDGGATYANIAGATSTTLTFLTYQSENGYLYRAVFTNRVGTATTTSALLTVESDTGGGGDVRIGSGFVGVGLAPLNFGTVLKRKHGRLFE
jgi:hypothetical protein